MTALAPAPAGPKRRFDLLSPAAVHFRKAAEGEPTCHACVHRVGSQCSIVNTLVNRQTTCDLYAAKAAGQRSWWKWDADHPYEAHPREVHPKDAKALKQAAQFGPGQVNQHHLFDAHLRNAETSKGELHRGTGPLTHAPKEGDKIDLPLSSFFDKPTGHDQTMLHVEPGAWATHLGEGKHLAGGQFRVTKVEQDKHGTTHVHLRQKYDVPPPPGHKMPEGYDDIGSDGGAGGAASVAKHHEPPKPLPPHGKAWGHDRSAEYEGRDLHGEGEWPAASKASRYGAVAFDDQGRILLREPKSHFDGYVWTFPKGHPDAKADGSMEHPTETARRETIEETGRTGAIVGHIPGGFSGTGSANHYYLMHLDDSEHPDFLNGETERLTWATPEEAEGLIKQSTNAAGRERDLWTLHAAVAEHAKLYPQVSQPMAPRTELTVAPTVKFPSKPFTSSSSSKPGEGKPPAAFMDKLGHVLMGGSSSTITGGKPKSAQAQAMIDAWKGHKADDTPVVVVASIHLATRSADGLYWAGEHGPETFVPSTSTAVVPSAMWLEWRAEYPELTEAEVSAVALAALEPDDDSGLREDEGPFGHKKLSGWWKWNLEHPYVKQGHHAQHDEGVGSEHHGAMFWTHLAQLQHTANVMGKTDKSGTAVLAEDHHSDYIKGHALAHEVGTKMANEGLDSKQISDKSAPLYAAAKKSKDAGDHAQHAQLLGAAHGFKLASQEQADWEKAHGVKPHEDVAGNKGVKHGAVHASVKSPQTDAIAANAHDEAAPESAHLATNPYPAGSQKAQAWQGAHDFHYANAEHHGADAATAQHWADNEAASEPLEHHGLAKAKSQGKQAGYHNWAVGAATAPSEGVPGDTPVSDLKAGDDLGEGYTVHHVHTAADEHKAGEAQIQDYQRVVGVVGPDGQYTESIHHETNHANDVMSQHDELVAEGFTEPLPERAKPTTVDEHIAAANAEGFDYNAIHDEAKAKGLAQPYETAQSNHHLWEETLAGTLDEGAASKAVALSAAKVSGYKSALEEHPGKPSVQASVVTPSEHPEGESKYLPGSPQHAAFMQGHDDTLAYAKATSMAPAVAHAHAEQTNSIIDTMPPGLGKATIEGTAAGYAHHAHNVEHPPVETPKGASGLSDSVKLSHLEQGDSFPSGHKIVGLTPDEGGPAGSTWVQMQGPDGKVTELAHTPDTPVNKMVEAHNATEDFGNDAEAHQAAVEMGVSTPDGHQVVKGTVHMENHSGHSNKFYESSVHKVSDGDYVHRTRYGSTYAGSKITENDKHYGSEESAVAAHEKIMEQKLGSHGYLKMSEAPSPASAPSAEHVAAGIEKMVTPSVHSPTPSSSEHAPLAESDLTAMTKLSPGEKFTNGETVPNTGSNGGQWYEDKHGTGWLVKNTKSDAHAENEVAGALAYREAGLHAPDVRLVKMNDGTLRAASKYEPGLTPLNPKDFDPDTQAEVRKGFGMDAMMSHYDLTGMVVGGGKSIDGNNLFRDKQGNIVRVDLGGTGRFRAQGTPKSAKEWSEGDWAGNPHAENAYETLRKSDQGKLAYGEGNYSSPEGKKVQAEQIESLKQTAGNFDSEHYRQAMIDAGVSPTFADSQVAVVKARQEHILAKVGGPSVKASVKQPASAPTAEAAEPKAVTAVTVTPHVDKQQRFVPAHQLKPGDVVTGGPGTEWSPTTVGPQAKAFVPKTQNKWGPTHDRYVVSSVRDATTEGDAYKRVEVRLRKLDAAGTPTDEQVSYVTHAHNSVARMKYKGAGENKYGGYHGPIAAHEPWPANTGVGKTAVENPVADGPKIVKTKTSVMAKNLKAGDVVVHHGGIYVKLTKAGPGGLAPGTLEGHQVKPGGEVQMHMPTVTVPIHSGGQTKVQKLTAAHYIVKNLHRPGENDATVTPSVHSQSPAAAVPTVSAAEALKATEIAPPKLSAAPADFQSAFTKAFHLRNWGVTEKMPEQVQVPDDDLKQMPAFRVAKQAAITHGKMLKPQEAADLRTEALELRKRGLSSSAQAAALGTAEGYAEAHAPTVRPVGQKAAAVDPTTLPSYAAAAKSAAAEAAAGATSRDLYAKAGTAGLSKDPDSQAKAIAYKAQAEKVDAEENPAPQPEISEGQTELTPAQVEHMQKAATEGKGLPMANPSELHLWAYDQGRAAGLQIGNIALDGGLTASDIEHAALHEEELAKQSVGLQSAKHWGAARMLHRVAESAHNGKGLITSNASVLSPKPDVSYHPPGTGTGKTLYGNAKDEAHYTEDEIDSFHMFTGPYRFSSANAKPSAGAGAGHGAGEFYAALNTLLGGGEAAPPDPVKKNGSYYAHVFLKACNEKSVPSQMVIYRGTTGGEWKSGEFEKIKAQVAAGTPAPFSLPLSSCTYNPNVGIYQGKPIHYFIDQGALTMNGTYTHGAGEGETNTGGLMEIYKIQKMGTKTVVYMRQTAHYAQ